MTPRETFRWHYKIFDVAKINADIARGVKAAGRRLAEAGATTKMIMAILGHTTFAEAERYTEEADQESLADDAVIRLEGHKANRIAQTAFAGLGKMSKKKGKPK